MKKILFLFVLTLICGEIFCQHNFLIDPRTGVKFVIHRDRRTITAEAKNGKLLWKANPFKEFKQEFIYDDGKIYSIRFSKRNKGYLDIIFVAPSWGIVNMKTGKVEILGRD